MAPNSAGWTFNHAQGRWVAVEAGASGARPPAPLGPGAPHALRLATLSCLHDISDPELLEHETRQDAIFRELGAPDADAIGPNEVTHSSFLASSSTPAEISVLFCLHQRRVSAL